MGKKRKLKKRDLFGMQVAELTASTQSDLFKQLAILATSHSITSVHLDLLAEEDVLDGEDREVAVVVYV